MAQIELGDHVGDQRIGTQDKRKRIRKGECARIHLTNTAVERLPVRLTPKLSEHALRAINAVGIYSAPEELQQNPAVAATDFQYTPAGEL